MAPPNPVLFTPPDATEIEVSLFGPGVGECVVLHLGSGFWIVVDSCIDRTTRRPVALEYLSGLGVPVHTALQKLILTHWHDDHIRGAAELLREAVEARLVISGALGRKEFLSLVGLRHPSGGPRGVQEMAELFRITEGRRIEGVRRAGFNITLANENTLLVRKAEPHAVEVTSLSPSSESALLAVAEFARLMPKYMDCVNDLRLGPNDAAVVLHVKVGDRAVLLGSDLENRADPRLGWRAIIDSAERPQSRSEVFKVAHHGAQTGHEPSVWTEMLAHDPCALLTPYRSQKIPLPTEEDLRRLNSLTSKVFLTASPRIKEPPPRSRTVEKIVKDNVLGRTVRESAVGHIRLRAPIYGDADWRVELFNGAFQVTDAA